MDIVHALVEGRKRRGVTIKSMAKLVGVTPTTLERYESGERPMPLPVAEKYAEGLKSQLLFIPKDMSL